MQRFADLVLRLRLPIILTIILLTLFFGYKLKNVHVNSNILIYLKPDDSSVKLFNRIGEQYAGTALAMVGIEADDVFDYLLQIKNVGA